MANWYKDYTKTPVNITKLTMEIEDDGLTPNLVGIEDDNSGSDNLRTTFDAEVTGGELTTLDATVAAHDGAAATYYTIYCYDCGCSQGKRALAALTACPVCSGTDIQTAYHRDNLDATSDPTVDDDDTQGYCEGSHKINVTTDKAFICLDNATGAAVWKEVSQITTVGNGLLRSGDTVSVKPDVGTGGNMYPADVGVNGVGVNMNEIAGEGLEADGAANLKVDPDSETGVTVAPVAVGANGVGVTVDNDTIKHTAGSLHIASGIIFIRKDIGWSSDKGVDLEVISGTHRIPIMYAGTPTSITIKSIRVMVGTVPTGAAIILDIHKNGTTIFTTQGNRPTIAISANDSGEVTNMDVTTVAKGDYFTLDVDQIGSTIAGKDLVVTLEMEIVP